MSQKMNDGKYSFTVPPEASGMRMDAAAASMFPDISRVRIQRAIAGGMLSVNGKVCTGKRFAASEGDVVEFSIPPDTRPVKATPEKISLDVLYEDEDILVINKPAGMVVHPAAGNWSGTVVNAVLGRENASGADFEDADPLRPGIVHRLDKDTSGCLVIAKNPDSMHKLTKAFAERKVSKLYAAIVSPAPVVAAAEIKTFIGRHPVNRKKMAVVRDSKQGRDAYTVFTVRKKGRIGNCTAALLDVRIMTGRTHQIRVHMAYRGMPVIGDSLYGGNCRIPAPRQMLHAMKLSFPHPRTGEILTFEAPLPPDFTGYANMITEG